MNYCTKCASLYSKPGTCNCYAPVTPAATTITWTRPYYCTCVGVCRCMRSGMTYTGGASNITMFNDTASFRCCADAPAPDAPTPDAT